jgi:hypothetical protein|tara:strand:- start:10216 stop:10815 length:600 start_codon:yes stop_codon:yes gene_type:complete
MKPRDKPHYVNNREFSLSVVEYVKTANAAAAAETEIPKVTDYIATCFLKISEGLSHKSNFIRYTYREEMVMDAVENCLKAIGNYNIEAATRSGNPNAFAYFTQICWYAFLRRIAREKKQQDIKLKYISQSPFEDFAVVNADEESLAAAHMFVDQLKSKIDQLKEKDTYIDAIVKEKKKERKKRDMAANSSDSDLGEIFK